MGCFCVSEYGRIQVTGAAGGTEKLGQMLVMDQDPNAAATPKSQWSAYTAEQARAAAATIADGPSVEVAAAYDATAATGNGFDVAKARLFHERANACNATQAQLKQDLLACADELDELAPRPLWHFVLGGLALLGLVVFGLKAAVSHSRPRGYRATSHRVSKHRSA